MNIAVCVKQVPDTETKIKILGDKRQIDESDINFILNPYDEFAVEEAIKTKEAFGGEITIISLGPDRVTATIRSALAMGAEKAIHIKVDKTPADPGVTAKALASILKESNFDMIFMGKQAIDDDNAQVTPMVSELLDIPAVNVVTKLEISGDQITAQRQIEGGFEKVVAQMPIIISTQRGLNEPRYASLRGIMAAKKISIEEKSVEIGSDQIEVVEMSYPPEKPAGRIVGEGPEAVPELLRLLREEAKVIS